MIYPCFTDVILNGDMVAVSSTGATSPYVGTATLFVRAPTKETPDQYVITCDVNGHWEHTVYVDIPGVWRYVARVGASVHAATLDLVFTISETAFPAPV